MPNAHRSWYSRNASGADYIKHIGEEVPQKAQQFFRISAKRELNTIAGLSMGGYGAWKMALHYPERFHAAASLSGVTDICQRAKKEAMEIVKKEWDSIFGSHWEQHLAHSENDLHHLLTTLSHHALKPRLYQCVVRKIFCTKPIYRRNH
jgi:putative tributyrin esterase